MGNMAQRFCQKITFLQGDQPWRQGGCTYGGPELEQLLDNLPDPADTDITDTCLPEYIRGSGDAVNEYHKVVYKLNKHFITLVNKGSAHSRFDTMTRDDLTMAEYYVSLKQQAAKCKFTNEDDVVRTKIIHTMRNQKAAPRGHAEKP